MLTIELLFFISLFLIGVFFATVKTGSYFYYIFSLLIFTTYSFVVRNSGFDADIGNYNQYLEMKSFSIYYLKEPIYWLGSRFIYKYSDSPIFVFMLYDFLFFVIILAVTRKLGLPKYFPYAVVVFFPSVLGMQNVFRQFIASGFLLLFLSYVMIGAGYAKKLMVLLLAVLSHNVAALFFPLIFIKPQARKLSALFVLSGLAILILLPVAAGTKSHSNTGDLPPYLYLVILVMLVALYLCVLKFRVLLFSPKYTAYLWIMLYTLALVLMAMFVTGEAQAKRLGMLSMLLTLVPLISVIDLRFKNKLLVRIIFLMVLAAPTLIFGNARILLLTNEQTLAIEAASRAQSGH